MELETATSNRLGNRANNQDRCTIVQRGHCALLVVADGMGGHDRGELAAEVIVRSLQRSFERSPLPLPDATEFLRQSLQNAHREIISAGLRQRPAVYPRATAVACVVQQMRAYWAHVGDSRLYLIRDSQRVSRTRDHTFVEELHHQKAISDSELPRHPLRHYVTHCLGGPDSPPRISVGPATALQFGDLVLLCSDGLWGPLPEHDLCSLESHSGELESWLNGLTQRAEEAAYPQADNITAAAVRLSAALDVDPAAPEEESARQPVEEPDRQQDRLADAICQIRNAIAEYEDELDRD